MLLITPLVTIATMTIEIISTHVIILHNTESPLFQNCTSAELYSANTRESPQASSVYVCVHSCQPPLKPLAIHLRANDATLETCTSDLNTHSLDKLVILQVSLAHVTRGSLLLNNTRHIYVHNFKFYISFLKVLSSANMWLFVLATGILF